MANLTKVLVLDDEEDTEDLFLQKFRHQIEDGEYEFSFATSLEQTEQLLKIGRPDIFLTDINVNGIDGIELISRLRKDYPMMRSVVISAYGDISTLRAVMRG
ncbi:MAG: response regulator, partial [Alphaproteobacteria bacterium]|nr:response regulator [Alphaproteobacteria bacterium]